MMCLFSLGMTKAYNTDFVVRVLAGFELEIEWKEPMNEMASQVIGGAVSQLQVLEICSFLRGYHAYMEIWMPVMGETLVVKREPTSRHYMQWPSTEIPKL